MEKISVIIPTYNRSQELKRSMESVLRQTYTEIELLVVDDGSEDDTQSVVESIQDQRVRYIKLARNQGVSAARNEGVRQADGRLIAFQDSDDAWRVNKLEKQMEYWTLHPEFSLIYCAGLVHQGEGHRVPDTDWEELEGSIFPRLLLHNTMDTPTMLMKKKCFQEVGGFDTSLRSLEDWDFALRFALKYQIGYVDQVLVDSYCSPGGISSNVSAYYESRCRLIARYREQLLKYGIFDLVLEDVFQKAQQRGILDQVKKMLLFLMRG